MKNSVKATPRLEHDDADDLTPRTTQWTRRESRPFVSEFNLPVVAMPPTFGKAKGPEYDGRELGPATHRPGAMDAYSLPSRFGKTLAWRDGRVEVAQ